MEKDTSGPEIEALRHNETHDVGKHEGEVHGIETSVNSKLHRGLKARHISMIAIGGAIGTGLIIGTGQALVLAGPGSIFIAYTIIGFVCFLVMAALGEMAAWLPMSSGFAGYATRYCDASLGFAFGWSYWLKYLIITPNQLTAAALVLQYWIDRETVNPGVFIAIFIVIICVINFCGIKFFGEIEFWFCSLKVLIIVGIIIFSFVLAVGGGPDGDAKGFRCWSDPGAFKPYILEGYTGQFLGFWSVMVNATFAYLGTELVGVTVAEAQNPRKTVPKAVKLTFYRIIIFYCLSILFIGMLVPRDSPELAFAAQAKTSASASPFVVAAQLAGIKVVPHIINGSICLFVLSAANTDLYIASRTLYSLASDGAAPALFKKTNKHGLPIYALGLSALSTLLAFMNISQSSAQVFTYLVNLIVIFGLICWIAILVTHIAWCHARKAQDLPSSALPYAAPLGVWGSYIALFICVLVALTKNYAVFVTFDGEGFSQKYVTFITGYLGIPVFLLLIFGHKYWKGTPWFNPRAVDLYSGKDIVDQEENEFLAEQAARWAAKGRSRRAWVYHTFFSWLF